MFPRITFSGTEDSGSPGQVIEGFKLRLKRDYKSVSSGLITGFCILLFISGCGLLSQKKITYELGDKSLNYVFICMDTLRGDYLGSSGLDVPASPNLDRLAQLGTVYSDVTVQGTYTLPSHASMLSGIYVNRHGVMSPHHRIPETLPYLPAMLQDAGYHTAAFTGGGFVSELYGFNRGFDHFEVSGTKFQNTVPAALRYLDTYTDKHPFFLFLHAYDVHLPLNSPEPYCSMFDTVGRSQSLVLDSIPCKAYTPDQLDLQYYLGQYCGELRHADDQLNQLFRYFKDNNLFENTVFIITSDHGEEYMDHGAFTHRFISLYNSNISVPLIVIGPGIPTGKIIDRPVESVDIVPWILETAGMEIPPVLDGKSLTAKGKSSSDQLIFSESSNFNSLYLITLSEVMNPDVCIRTGMIGSLNSDIDLLTALRQEMGNRDDLITYLDHHRILINYDSTDFLIQMKSDNESDGFFIMNDWYESEDSAFDEKTFAGVGLVSDPPESPDPAWNRFEHDGFVYHIPDWYHLKRYYNEQSVRLKSWKLFYDFHADSVRLFNMDTDPGEKIDLAEFHPEIVDNLKKEIESLFEGKTRFVPEKTWGNDSLDQSTLDQLRQLGYIADK